MHEPQLAEVRQWLRKAESDLGSASRLGEGPEPYLDTALYHVQQAAEKALKAFLACREIRFQRTHDLDVLLSACAVIAPEFEELRTACQLLTPYAALYRYPGEAGEPTSEEFEEALQAAVTLYTRVLARIPQEAHPSKP